MQKSFITTVATWRFERPLALALAASAVFMVMAVPPARLSAFPSLSAFPGFQPVLAGMLGVVLGVLGYLAMVYPWPHVAVAKAMPEEELVPDDELGQFAAAEVSLRLRRADRHPDAPVREPIFASRDLGSPFMEVGAFAPPPPEEPAEHAIPEGDYAEVDIAPGALPHEDAEPDAPAEPEPEAPTDAGAHTGIEPAAEPVTVVEPEWSIAEMPAPIAAFAPEEAPAPAPSRPERQSISAMMERLSAGLERRAAHDDMPRAAQDRGPALRDALAELNRLAARRG